MPIKKLTVSFDLPINTFLSMLAAGNSGLKIDVFGDDHPKQRRLNGQAPKLLEGPSRKGFGRGVRGMLDGKPVNGRHIALKHFAENKDRHVNPKELGSLLISIGLSANPSSLLTAFKTRGLIKRIGKAAYGITAKGLSEYAKQTAEASHG